MHFIFLREKERVKEGKNVFAYKCKFSEGIYRMYINIYLYKGFQSSNNINKNKIIYSLSKYILIK